ncbi:MAG: metallophosphoesterase [Candidatus Woesearchaeota archaeon]
MVLLRILGAGDIHGNVFLARDLAERAVRENVDLVVLCGDLIEDSASDNVLKPFRDKDLKMLLVHGNHESLASANFLAYINKAKLMHGYGARYGDIGFFGCGSANIGVNGLSEDEIFSTLNKAHDGISYLQKKVMITHVHPAGSDMEKFSAFVPGSLGVSDAIKQFKPDILLCSHVHEAQGLEEQLEGTRVINVGPKGKIIDL